MIALLEVNDISYLAKETTFNTTELNLPPVPEEFHFYNALLALIARNLADLPQDLVAVKDLVFNQIIESVPEEEKTFTAEEQARLKSLIVYAANELRRPKRVVRAG